MATLLNMLSLLRLKKFSAYTRLNEPSITKLVELKTEDGVFLTTVDGNYLGTQG